MNKKKNIQYGQCVLNVIIDGSQGLKIRNLARDVKRDWILKRK